MLAAAEAAMPKERDFRQRQARRRDAIGLATSRSGWRRSSRQWQRWRPTPGWRRRRASHRGRKGTAAPAEAPKKPGKPAAAPSDQPDPKSQRNFTDPESRHHEVEDGFVQAYNAQAAVDAGAQVIVAHELTQCGSDQGQLVP